MFSVEFMPNTGKTFSFTSVSGNQHYFIVSIFNQFTFSLLFSNLLAEDTSLMSHEQKMIEKTPLRGTPT